MNFLRRRRKAANQRGRVGTGAIPRKARQTGFKTGLNRGPWAIRPPNFEGEGEMAKKPTKADLEKELARLK